jgi:3-phenylpropionate/trans-cinnamate dioxygenase ferredoxin reductase subunit
MSGVVIIGAGHAGSQLAVSLKAEGFGGAVTLIDSDASLPYHKPPLSKTFLNSATATAQWLRAETAYDEAGVARLTGTVSAIDVAGRVISVDGGALGYDDLVLATGARNRQLHECEGASNAFSLRTLADAVALRDALPSAQRIAVIGGGFIGLETAAALAAMGKQVTVLEAAPRILARVAAPETSGLVSQTLIEKGVELRVNWCGSGFARTGDRVTEIQGEATAVATDLILVGIGASAATELAENVGIACNLGVLTDAALATSAPHVWAIGDVAETPHWQTERAERIESVQNAVDQARTLAKTLASGQRQIFRSVPWFWSDIGPLKLQIAGLSHGADARIIRKDGASIAVFHMRGGRLVAVETVNCPTDHMIARRLIEKGVTPTEDQILAGPRALKPLAA